MLQIKFIKTDGSAYEIKNIFNFEITGNFIIMCLDDMKTRVVRPLADLAGYELKDMPVVKQGKSKRANNTKKAVNNMDPIQNVCTPCGISANVLTCLKKFGQRPKKLAFSISCVHKGVCDFCKEETEVTEVRDFFYPDFELLKQATKI